MTDQENRVPAEFSEEEGAVGNADGKLAGIPKRRGRPTNAERAIKAGNDNRIESFLVRDAPTGTSKSNADICAMLAGLVEEIKDLKSQIRSNNDNFLEEIRDLKKDLKEKEVKWANEKAELVKKIGDLENKVGQLEIKADNTDSAQIEAKLRRVERVLEMQERKEKMNNIVIKGAKIGNENIKLQVEQLLESKLGVGNCVTWAATRGNNENKIIVAGIENFERKKEILKNKHKLRGSNIFIDWDLTRAEREVQNKIVSMAREERSKGKEVKIGFQKIRVNGIWKGWEQEVQRERRQVF